MISDIYFFIFGNKALDFILMCDWWTADGINNKVKKVIYDK